MKLKIFFLTVLFFAFFGDWIANEKPVYCQFEGKSYFPIFEVPFVKLGWIDWPADFKNENWGNIGSLLHKKVSNKEIREARCRRRGRPSIGGACVRTCVRTYVRTYVRT